MAKRKRLSVKTKTKRQGRKTVITVQPYMPLKAPAPDCATIYEPIDIILNADNKLEISTKLVRK
jgi:hypothetical protein